MITNFRLTKLFTSLHFNMMKEILFLKMSYWKKISEYIYMINIATEFKLILSFFIGHICNNLFGDVQLHEK